MSVPGPPVIRPRPRVTSTTYEVWWQPPVSDGGSPITGYYFYCPNVYTNYLGPTDGYTIIANYLATNTDYTFYIEAINANGNGPPAVFRTVRLGNPPDAPTAASVTRDASGVVTFNWTNPVNTGGIPLGWNMVTAFPIDAAGSVQKWNTFGTDETLTLGAGNPTTLNPEKTYVGLIQGRNDAAFCPRTTFTAPITFGYQPTDVSGMSLWLDAADGNTLFQDGGATQNVGVRLNGQPVKAWRDTATAATFVTTGTGSIPRLTFSGYNATYPAVAFTNATKYLDSSGSLTLTTHNTETLFLVLQCPVTDTSPVNIITAGIVSVGSLIDKGSGSLTLSMDGAPLIPPSGDPFLLTTSPTLITMYANASNVYADQLQPSSVSGSAVRSGNSLNDQVSMSINSAVGGSYDFRISELLVYDRALSDGERFRVATYLSRKWGLSLPTLPSLILFLRGSQAIVGGTPSWPDQSASFASGSLQNGTAALDASGIAVYLDGSSNWVVPNLGSHNAFTVNVWYKDLGTAATESPCIITEQWSSTPINFAITRGQGITAGKWACGFFSPPNWYFGTEFDLSGNEWLNIQFTWDGSDIRTYINGALIGTINHSGSTASSSNLPIRLGRRWDNAEYMTGNLGEVRIYNRALTDAEVVADFTASSSIFL